MLDYEWGNPSTIMLSGEEPEPPPGSDPSNHNFLHHYTSTAPTAFGDNLLAPTQPTSNDPTTTNHFAHHFEPQSQGHHHIQNNFYDPRVYPGASNYAPHHSSMLSLDPGFMMLPKSEESIGRSVDFTSRIGLNLGGRTYFSSEDDFMSRLYRRTRPLEPGTNNLPRCQAEGCNADLSHAKHYHRRHKVCEFHSKASTVIAAGLTQRFCQQCSRFHLLSEFDNGKRSCRKRLADHNRRRRKTQQSNHENPKSQVETARNSSSDHMNGSPSDSGAHSSCSVTIAVSPPGITFDGFRQRPYQTSGAARSSSSTGSSISSSLFFSK